MLIVVALGGNALLLRSEPMTAENQRRNVRIAANALAPVAERGRTPRVCLAAVRAGPGTPGGPCAVTNAGYLFSVDRKFP